MNEILTAIITLKTVVADKAFMNYMNTLKSSFFLPDDEDGEVIEDMGELLFRVFI